MVRPSCEGRIKKFNRGKREPGTSCLGAKNPPHQKKVQKKKAPERRCVRNHEEPGREESVWKERQKSSEGPTSGELRGGVQGKETVPLLGKKRILSQALGNNKKRTGKGRSRQEAEHLKKNLARGGNDQICWLRRRKDLFAASKKSGPVEGEKSAAKKQGARVREGARRAKSPPARNTGRSPAPEKGESRRGI